MTFPISMIAVGESEPVICDITTQSAISLKYQNIKLKTRNESYSEEILSILSILM